MATNPARKYLVLAGLTGLSLFVGCVATDEISDESEQAYALRAEMSGSSDSKKTYVCHIPPGNPANGHTIHIGNAAVDAHLAHGDSLGQCEVVLVSDSGKCKGKGKGHQKSIQNVVQQDGKSWKATICHLPPGNPENAHTLSVGVPAVDAHLAHGDSLGACVETDGADALVKDCPDTDTDTDTDTTDTTGGKPDTGTDTTGTGGKPDTGTDTTITVPADNT